MGDLSLFNPFIDVILFPAALAPVGGGGGGGGAVTGKNEGCDCGGGIVAPFGSGGGSRAWPGMGAGGGGG